MVSAAQAAAGPPRRRREAGYNLVILVMAIALLNIFVAAMLPLWSTQIRREKEEELIFRGLQYSEAIRLFQKRYQRFPTTLKELVDIQPRCIRQLWKDPMTEDGKWALIYQGQGTPLLPALVLPGRGGQLPGAGRFGRTPTGRGGGTAPGSGTPGEVAAGGEQPETVAAGPIVGVHSRSTRKSIEIWNGQQEYDLWNFTYDLLALRPARGGQQGQPAGAPSLTAVRWIGRPFPGVQQVPGLQPITAVPVPGAPGVGMPGRPGGAQQFPGGAPPGSGKP